MENKGIALAILGIVAVIAVVGLVLLFKGATGNVAYRPYPFITQDGQRACGLIQCQNGQGAVYVGESNTPGVPSYACICPNQFQEQRIADWSNQWRGDEGHDGLSSYDDGVRYVSQIRTY